MTSIQRDYTYWQDALALGDLINHDREHIAPMEPQAGFYRTRRNEAVAIWPDEDGLNFLVNGRQLHPNEFEDVWLKVCRRPVTEAQWRNFGATGKWHDVDPAVDETIGHNIDSAADAPTIADLLKILQDAAGGYKKITSDEEQARAHSLRARINSLRLRAEKLHKAEKEPHLKAGQAVDRTWNPMIKDATMAGTTLGRAMGMWEDEKRAAIRRAEIEAEEARRKAEEAKKAGEPVPAPPPAPAPLPEPKSAVRSGYGRAAAVKIRNVVVDITDLAALMRRYSQTDEVRQVLTMLAQRDVDAGLTVEGVKVEEQSTVR